MMRSAIVEDGVVVNVIIGQIDGSVPCADDVAIGWTYDEQAFVPPAPAPVEPIPVVAVSARQFKLQLLAVGLIDQVEAWAASQGREVQIAYENSGSFVRTEQMMQAGFLALGFTEPQINAFFEAASEL